MSGGATAVLRGLMLTSAFSLAACAAAPRPEDSASTAVSTGVVSFKLLPTPATGQYKLRTNEHAFGAEPTARATPVYPEALTSQNLPEVTVRVKAIVNEQGAVIEVRDIEPSSDIHHGMFIDACRGAMMRWSFTPMVVVTEVNDGTGTISPIRTAKAFSQDYSFTFRLVGGRPIVTSDR
jgi:hypothetical protein